MILWMIYALMIIYIAGVFITTNMWYQDLRKVGALDTLVKDGDVLHYTDEREEIEIKFEFTSIDGEEFIFNHFPVLYALLKKGVGWPFEPCRYRLNINGVGVSLSQRDLSIAIVLLVVIVAVLPIH